MGTIASALQAVHDRIAQAAAAAGRNPSEVALLAVSKTWPAERVREAHLAGQSAFGENYLQEALRKMAALPDLPLEWHFIGPIQSNKTRLIAERFAWVHSLEREKLAERLSQARPVNLPPLNVCVQVNVSGEAAKSGVSPEEAPQLARFVARLPRLKLRGLMAIPEFTPDLAVLRARFRMLRKLKEQLCAEGMALDTLSMGMSGDLEAAIAEGATIVRVGTAIFGERGFKP